MPLAAGSGGRSCAFVRDLLLSETSLGRGIFEPGQIRRIVAQPERGQEDLDLQLWTLMSFELWCRRSWTGAVAADRRGRSGRSPGRRDPVEAVASPTPRDDGVAARQSLAPSLRPRIAMVVASLDIVGGHGVQAATLAAQLREDGYAVTLRADQPAVSARARLGAALPVRADRC